MVALVSTPNILNCGSSLPFWVYWDHVTEDIAIGQGWYPGVNQIMFYHDTAGLLDVTFGGVGTLGIFPGAWHFPRGRSTFLKFFNHVHQLGRISDDNITFKMKHLS